KFVEIKFDADEIQDLSNRFLAQSEDGTEGSMITAVYEGTRPLLLEIQALVAPANIGFARRTAIGVEQGRLSMILAVLEKKAGLSLINQDVYVNVVGGLKPEGTSTDLAVALAIHSTFREKICDPGVLALGEIGLTGELRNVQNAEKIVKEAIRMGFKKIILPKAQKEKLAPLGEKINLIGVKHIREAITAYSGR
ncbi:MAG: magnesium chelatase domain-containing protein, partial [Anaerovoracaceae bacterium]